LSQLDTPATQERIAGDEKRIGPLACMNTGRALPRQINEALAHGKELAKEAKGLGE
jgi:hypothetical protein